MISDDEIRAAFVYHPDTGMFERTHGAGGRAAKGKFAGAMGPRGYRMVGLGKKTYLAHRLAYLCVMGVWPPSELDHINCERGDNRWSNLRLADRSDNLANSRQRRSTLKGAYRMGDRWKSSIRRNGIERHLGCYATEEDAHAAYMRAAQLAHGEFARAC